MKRFLPILPSAPQQRGVSVVAAIFLLLLMAVLVAAIANMVSSSNANMAADIGGARAYQAARAGAEWGMFQLDPNAQNAALANCFAPATPPIPGHVVNVQCASTDYTEAGRSIRIYQITSSAVAVGVKAPGIERVVEVKVEKCRDPVNVPAAPFDC